MSGLASQLLQDEFAAFSLMVLAQCTAVAALALLAASVLKRDAAARQTVLRTGMVCAMLCPLVTLGLNVGDVTLISIPVHVQEADLVAPRRIFSSQRTRKSPSPAPIAPPVPVLETAAQIEPRFQAGTATTARKKRPTSRGHLSLVLTSLMPQTSALPGGVGLFTLRWKLEERISGLLDERRKKEKDRGTNELFRQPRNRGVDVARGAVHRRDETGGSARLASGG